MPILKHSHQRDKILEILKNAKCHPTASYVYEKAKEEIPNISLGTVYRNLALLCKDGQIRKLDLGTGSDHFDGDTTPHYHIICTVCHSVTDVFGHDDELNGVAMRRFDGIITEHSLVFYGKCGNCMKKI